jgi:hypothetical protein
MAYVLPNSFCAVLVQHIMEQQPLWSGSSNMHNHDFSVYGRDAMINSQAAMHALQLQPPASCLAEQRS